MSIKPGTRIGPYEVASSLGEGGMGVVFRAHDTKLRRDVALKLLPGNFTDDPERLARFQREAQVLASLNHPNIAQIYGLEESDNTRCIVMELVEGETLQQRLKRGSLSVDEALQIAKQVVEALEAAHEKGIIHRDLKPANIKVTPNGQVKVLDFGLAKAWADDVEDMTLSNSPTLISTAATNAGVILGTAAYMSPEQARGMKVDRRTDIFSFGAVLYEMLTGKQAFNGNSVSDILAAVLRVEPDWTRLPKDTLTAIRRLLRRCLQKDRTRRLQTAIDVLIELEEAKTDPEPSAPTIVPAAPSRVRERMLAFGFLLLAALLAIPAVMHLRETLPLAPLEMRTEIVTPATTDPISFALSPDGSHIVFVAAGDGQPRLWVRSLNKTTAQPLPGTEGASYPFWSPDNRSIGFFDGTKMKRIDLAGGSPQTITETTFRGGSWNPDGIIIFPRSFNSPLFRVPVSGGEAAAITKLDKENSHRFPEFLPGGRQFLFYAQGTAGTAGIYLSSLDSPEAKRLTESDAAGLYIPERWLLFIRGGTLLARRLDVTRGELKGDPVTVADSVAFDATANAAAISVSSAGLIAYRAGGANRRQLTWFDRSGKMLGTLGAADENGLASPSLSPDGRRVAVSRTVQGNTDIWILDADRITRLTFDESLDRFPLWSADGNRIVFDSNRKGRRDLYQKRSDGAGAEEVLLESPEDKAALDWSRDGRFLLYSPLNTPKTGIDLRYFPLVGGGKTVVFLNTPFNEIQAQFSPDGKWVAYESDQSGRYEIYVRPFPGPGGQWEVSTSGGISPRWAPSGRELYYIAPDGKLMASPIVVRDAAIEPGTPIPLFQTRIYGGGTSALLGWQYDVSRDGRFLINTVLEDAAAPITLILNWHPERGK